MKIDTFDQFLHVLFEAPEEDHFEHDDAKLTDWYIRLFAAPDFLFERYSPDQLERGFGAMLNCNFDLAASELVWTRMISLDQRLQLISSFYDLFNRFFRKLSFEYATHMWWDAIAYAYECGNAVRGRSDEETRLQDAMFEVLVRTLAIDSSECQAAALHGLGHLHHPAGPEAIAEYIHRNPDLDSGLKQYAEQAALGMIL